MAASGGSSEMSTVAATEIGSPESGTETIPLGRVEAELDRRLELARAGAPAPVHRSRMSNLIIYCEHHEHACRVEDQVPEIVAIHPARVLLLNVDPSAHSDEV